MLVSVVVPVFNKEEYIRECLDSIVSQTYRELEILLVDGGSSDRSADICDEYAAADPRVKVIRTKSRGPAESVLVGTGQAKGDYFIFVDSDDWMDTDMVEQLANHTSGTAREIVLSDYVIEKEGGIQNFIYQDVRPGEYDRDMIMDQIIPRLWGLEVRAVSQSRCMKLFSRELVTANVNYPEPDLIFAEDGAFTVPCVLDADRLYFLDHKAMYHYRYVNDSSVHRYKPQMTDNIRRIRLIINRAIRDKFGSDVKRCDALLEMYNPEYVILLGFAVRNELLGSRDKCAENIRRICLEPENAALIREYPVIYRDLFNRMIYFVMKHPSAVLCNLLHFIRRMR